MIYMEAGDEKTVMIKRNERDPPIESRYRVDPLAKVSPRTDQQVLGLKVLTALNR